MKTMSEACVFLLQTVAIISGWYVESRGAHIITNRYLGFKFLNCCTSSKSYEVPTIRLLPNKDLFSLSLDL